MKIIPKIAKTVAAGLFFDCCLFKNQSKKKSKKNFKSFLTDMKGTKPVTIHMQKWP